MIERFLDPDVLKAGCGVAAALYGIAAIGLAIPAASRSNLQLRGDATIVAPIFGIVAIALALVAYEFSSASQPLLLILYPTVVVALAASGITLIVLAFRTLRGRTIRIAAILAALIPLAVSGLLMALGFLLAHSRFCC